MDDITLNITTFDVDFGVITESGTHVIYYDGSYEFTPTQETQAVQIKGLTAKENITINPIPQNYGKITWDGATLKVE